MLIADVSKIYRNTIREREREKRGKELLKASSMGPFCSLQLGCKTLWWDPRVEKDDLGEFETVILRFICHIAPGSLCPRR